MDRGVGKGLAIAALLVYMAGGGVTVRSMNGNDAKLFRPVSSDQPGGIETRLTAGPYHHWLTPFGPFSPDGRWLVYDTRAEEGAMGSNPNLEKVNTRTGEIVVLYQAPHQTPAGPGCGTASYNPADGRIVFIHGLPGAGPDRPYAVTRRAAAVLDETRPDRMDFLDARDITPPFTPGALRGGTHAHQWSADGRRLGFTYNDAVMAELGQRTNQNLDLRTVGVCVDHGPVTVDQAAENHDGRWRCALVARVTQSPEPGSDQISRAFENCWVGREGYLKDDGARQHAQAFLGATRDESGRELIEVYLADIPDRIDRPGPTGPLEGADRDFPQPPDGVVQRRLTRTTSRKFPGVVTEPRHWLAASPDGRFIAFLARDDNGVVQVFLVRPSGGPIIQLTDNPGPVQSAIAWSPDSARLAYVWDNSLYTASVSPGTMTAHDRLTRPGDAPPIYPFWSPDGRFIAYNREAADPAGSFRQIFILRLTQE